MGSIKFAGSYRVFQPATPIVAHNAEIISTHILRGISIALLPGFHLNNTIPLLYIQKDN